MVAVRAATSSQLPTVVLFEGGAEVERLPRRVGGSGGAGASTAKGRWRRADVERAFDLQRRAGFDAGAKAKESKKRK